MPTTFEFIMGQRTLVAEDSETVEAKVMAWRLNNSPFQIFHEEDPDGLMGHEKAINLNLVVQMLEGDQRTELDCLRDQGQLDGGLLAGRVPNSTTSSTPSTEPTE